MSRSQYVYVIQAPGGTVIGTWTAKKEMTAWLEANDLLLGAGRDLLHISCHHDARPHRRPVDLNPRTLEPAP